MATPMATPTKLNPRVGPLGVPPCLTIPPGAEELTITIPLGPLYPASAATALRVPLGPASCPGPVQGGPTPAPRQAPGSRPHHAYQNVPRSELCPPDTQSLHEV